MFLEVLFEERCGASHDSEAAVFGAVWKLEIREQSLNTAADQIVGIQD